MITKKDKELILELFKQVDVKQMIIDVDDDTKQKWFRFGSYNGMQVACEIIKNLPEPKRKKINVS